MVGDFVKEIGVGIVLVLQVGFRVAVLVFIHAAQNFQDECLCGGADVAEYALELVCDNALFFFAGFLADFFAAAVVHVIHLPIPGVRIFVAVGVVIIVIVVFATFLAENESVFGGFLFDPEHRLLAFGNAVLVELGVVFVVGIFADIAVPFVHRVRLFVFRDFGHPFLDKLLAERFNVLGNLLVEAFAVKAVATGDIAEQVRLLVAAVLAVLASFLGVKRSAFQERLFVHDGVLQVFGAAASGAGEPLLDVFLAAHREHFGVAQIDFAGCQVFHRLAAEFGDAAATFGPAGGLAKHRCNFRAGLALGKELLYGVCLVHCGHVLAHDVLGCRELVCLRVVGIDYDAGDCGEPEFLASL